MSSFLQIHILFWIISSILLTACHLSHLIQEVVRLNLSSWAVILGVYVIEQHPTFRSCQQTVVVTTHGVQLAQGQGVARITENHPNWTAKRVQSVFQRSVVRVILEEFSHKFLHDFGWRCDLDSPTVCALATRVPGSCTGVITG